MLTVSDLVGCRTGAKLKYLPRMKCVFLIGGKTPNDAECAPLLIADVEKILEDNKTTGKATPAGNAATTAGNAAATTGTGNAATRTDPTRTDQRLGGTHLDFVKVTCLEGSFNGIVGHDVCLVDNKVLVVGGVDTVHKEPIGGCSIISIDATTGFTRSPDRDFIFTRPMGCFDTLGCIQFAIDESLADVEFECGGPDSVILPAHMVILAGKSEYFCSSFQALKIATAKAATAIQRAGVARTAALRSAPDRRTVGELSTNSLATMVAAHTNSLVAGSESSYLPTPHLERPRRPRLQASHFATPVCFEVFLTLFYSYHLPTCLLVANSKANWSQEFPETDRQSMAVLVWFAMTHNYNNVLNGKPNVPLPFATKVVHDTISCLLVLAQLADEYLFDKLSAHLEVYLACLANEKTALDRLYQASTNFTMDKLKAYLEDVYQKKPTLMTTTPQPKYLPPPPTTSDHLPPGYGFRSTYTTECPDSPGTGISPGYSPAALPPLRERNYGSGRDMGRRPPPPVAHMTTQTDSRRLREILFKHR
ncbi:hypothetical protein GNI_093160 [Gregarina niphandrodes]|uniref:Uncharacterized protein n=1 Tax=Gregarina niphandrodes TaxID=110365 RepID=A0A023B5D0_GRENI|nr:hypothetical protein GNI_093160 [Gregarina niphandrodes]EZG59047.1 hypothetical protein GNI_093160 [Gregarina niphandrodes]|eukprot:XP_011130913.1 hypothetical protein GNI_093160 [Gregarina niphandrodes]